MNLKKDLDPLARIAAVSPWLVAEIRRRIAAETVSGRAARLNPEVVVKAMEHERDNGKVVLVVSVGTKGLTATRDLSDAAHLRRDPTGKFFPAAHADGSKRIPDARPRLYPPSQLTSAGVGIDSAFDAAHQRDGWLRENLGVNLVGERMGAAVERAVNAGRMNARGLSDVLCHNEYHEPGTSRGLERYSSKRRSPR